MKIIVLGAGAMGSMYGGMLSERNDVWLVDIWKDHIDAINRDGLRMKKKDGTEVVFHPHAVTDSKDAGHADLVIIFVKSIDTASALAANKDIFTEDTIVLTLQNGFGNDEDILPYVKENNLLIGTAAGGATMLGPGNVFQAGIDLTTIGLRPGCSLASAQTIVDEFNACGLESAVSENAMEIVWKKLLVNVGCSAVCAVLEKNNAFMDFSESAYAIGLELIKEACAVAKAEGYTFDAEAIAVRYFHEGAKIVGKNRCAMLQDVDRKRKTEIEKFNGAVSRLGKKHGISTPYNDVMLLMVKAKEDGYNYEN